MTDTEDSNTEPERKASRKWYVGDMAQLMVFLNGAILTLVAYLSLNVYVSGILQEEFNDITGNSFQIINDHLVKLENTVKTAGTIIELSPAENIEGTRERLLYAVPDIRAFERVI
jgi:hypothetical protein